MDIFKLCGIQEVQAQTDTGFRLIAQPEAGDGAFYIERALPATKYYPLETVILLISEFINGCEQIDNNPAAIDYAVNNIEYQTRRGCGKQVDNVIVYKGTSQFDAGIIIVKCGDQYAAILQNNWKDYYRVIK